MRIINSWMCPWLIAVYGKYFADTDNCSVVMEMLKNVIIDMRTAMINLCTRSREVAMRPQIVALISLGIRDLTHVFLSRASIRFIDEMCVEKGIVGAPVIFQTKTDKHEKMYSLVGTGATVHEKALRWIIGEFPFTFGPTFQHDLFLWLCNS